MKQGSRKILVNCLAVMVMLLPFSAMTMPVDLSTDHCMGNKMTADMHSMHEMDSGMDMEEAMQCDCCDKCVSDCVGCTSGFSAATLDVLQFSDSQTKEVFVQVNDFLFVHITSPPQRPPQILHV